MTPWEEPSLKYTQFQQEPPYQLHERLFQKAHYRFSKDCYRCINQYTRIQLGEA
jgi:hypothetical protein